MLKYPFDFPKISGRFRQRINRFVVEVEIEGRRVEAYLANPGRLWELLLPGTELLLSPAPAQGKLPYTVLACRKEGRYVLLHTHLTNKVVRHLIEEGRTPFADYQVVGEEPAYGKHRFDLLLQHQQSGAECYLEIKSCTLFSGRLAMFPDAVTQRGARHLAKLGELSSEGIETACLFVVMHPGAEFFLPSYHIDPHFTRTFLAVRNQVRLEAMAIDFDDTFTKVDRSKTLTIPYAFLSREFQDRGSYLLLMFMQSDQTIEVGRLGPVRFKRGYYVYAGSAMRSLSKRVARHKRKRKQIRWHIDYLSTAVERLTPIEIISSEALECNLACGLHNIAAETMTRFGSSDCNCPGHLFYFRENPLHNPHFIDLIQKYRIRRLADRLLSQQH